MERKRISSGSRYENPVGYSRAIRTGNHISVAGTAAIADDGSVAFPRDVYEQTKYCLGIIQRAIEEAGATLSDVVRTRVMLVDAETWRDAGRAHGEVFGSIRPACTFVEVSRFIDPGWLVEIEADCIVSK